MGQRKDTKCGQGLDYPDHLLFLGAPLATRQMDRADHLVTVMAEIKHIVSGNGVDRKFQALAGRPGA